MHIISRFWLGLACGLVAAGPAQGFSVTNVPAADCTLFENDPGNNLGRATLAAGSLAGQAQAHRARALLRFDLSEIPANAVVTNVRVVLWVTKSPSGAVGSVFGLHRVASDWEEGTRSGTRGGVALAGESTWNSRGPGPWAAPGGLAGTDYAATSSGSVSVGGNGPYGFGATAGLLADVQHWVAHPAQNFGWILISESEGVAKTARRFGHREGALAQAPSLVVEYSLGGVQFDEITLESGVVNLRFTVPAGFNYAVQGSGTMGLGSWTTFTNITAKFAAVEAIVPEAAGSGRRFYRIEATPVD